MILWKVFDEGDNFTRNWNVIYARNDFLNTSTLQPLLGAIIASFLVVSYYLFQVSTRFVSLSALLEATPFGAGLIEGHAVGVGPSTGFTWEWVG